MYQQQYNPYGANNEIVKGYLKSGKVLTLGILHLISIAVSVISTLTLTRVNLVYDYSDILRSMGIDPSDVLISMNSSLGGISASMIAGTFFSSLFTLLIAIGFIIMFAKSRNDHPSSNPSAGVGILRVISLITFICAIICVVLLVILFIAAYFFLDYFVNNSNMDSRSATIIWIACGVFILIFSFFFLFITASYKNFYRSIKRSLNTVDLHTKGAAAYGVFNIIGAVLMGMATLGTLITAISSFSAAALMSLVSNALSFIILIMTASFALGYNSYIKRQKYSYAAPYDGGPAGGAYYPNEPYDAPNPYAAPQQNEPPYQQNNYPEYQAPRSAPGFCPNCGAPVDGATPFCSNCGTRL